MIQAYILLTVSSGTERKVYQKLNELKEVEEVYELFGEYDMIIKIEVKDTKHLDLLVSDKIRTIREIKLTSTMIIAR